MSLQIHKIMEIFPDLVTLVRGSAKTVVRDLQAPESAARDSMIFVGNQEHFRAALSSASKIWVVSRPLEPLVPTSVTDLLVSPNVPLSIALIGNHFFPQTRHHQILSGEKIHPSARISPSSQIGRSCIIGPGAVIGDNCVLADECIIGANAVLEPDVKIGARSHIYPLVFVGLGCEIGADCEIHPQTTIGADGFGYAQDKDQNHYRMTHYGRVIIEDKVHIGAGVNVDRGTFLDSRIGAGTKIDNHCHFGHNIQIGKNTLITGGMIVAGSVTLGSYCVFGGRTTVAGHLQVTDHVHAAGLSGISKSITKPGAYGGLPLQDLAAEMRTRASLKSLPQLVKQVRRILKHLGLESESGSQTGNE